MAVLNMTWEDLIGGHIGEEFKKILRNRNESAVASFVRKYPFEANELLKSYKAAYGIDQPKLAEALKNRLEPSKFGKNINLLTLFLLSLFVLAISSVFVFSNTVLKQNSRDSYFISTQLGTQRGQNLSLLENNNPAYKLFYPSELNAVLTKEGIEFIPKEDIGKIILSIQDGIVAVNTYSSQGTKGIENLNAAAKTIQDSFKFVGSDRF